MKIGIIAFLHESNTFSSQPTDLDSFNQDLFVGGSEMRERLAESHHEVGGFFTGLTSEGAESVPLFAARALPGGTIKRDAFEAIVSRIVEAIEQAGKLDGILIAPHGATVSEDFLDADGYWMNVVRQHVGKEVPIIGTLDAHANLSPLMVKSCNALVAYRTNPHLDQRARGAEAAHLLVSTIRNEITPVMEARFPPLAIRIDRQCTEESYLRPLYEYADKQLSVDRVLSNSILLGFPYADVAEMGSSVIVVADGDSDLAREQADELANRMWELRHEFDGEFTGIQNAVEICKSSTEVICLLDMGDNVGGGSSADGTYLIAALSSAGIDGCFGCLYDPASVAKCEKAGVGSSLILSAGGKTDSLHGPPFNVEVKVQSLHDGVFKEPEPRHGGIVEFDQGTTAVCNTDSGLTLMLTSRRMVPFSLQQLISCGLDPSEFKVFVAKGVNAPIAAYRDVCQKFIRVNTPGSTCCDMTQLSYVNRRRPLYPFELNATFD